MLFQGLNVMEGSVFGKKLELLSGNVVAITQGINFVGIMKVKLAFCMGKLRVKWLKTGALSRYIPVLLTIRSAPPPPTPAANTAPIRWFSYYLHATTSCLVSLNDTRNFDAI